MSDPIEVVYTGETGSTDTEITKEEFWEIADNNKVETQKTRGRAQVVVFPKDSSATIASNLGEYIACSVTLVVDGAMFESYRKRV